MRLIPAIDVPSLPFLTMNEFCASEEFLTFIGIRSSPALESVAENSYFERPSLRGSYQRWDLLSAAWPVLAKSRFYWARHFTSSAARDFISATEAFLA
jgi:hypothetical protein